MNYGVGQMREYIRKKRIEKSGLFDPHFYVSTYTDVVESNLDPLSHYYYIGWKEGRRPNHYFDTKWYLARYPDVARTGVNPLYHYAMYGIKEGRYPSGEFTGRKAPKAHELAAHRPAFQRRSTGDVSCVVAAPAVAKRDELASGTAALPIAGKNMAIYVHVANADDLALVMPLLVDQSDQYRIYLSADSTHYSAVVEGAKKIYTDIRVSELAQGRNWWSLLLPLLKADRMEFFCCLSTQQLRTWQDQGLSRSHQERLIALSFQGLIGSKAVLSNVVDAFAQNPDVWLIGSALFHRPMAAARGFDPAAAHPILDRYSSSLAGDWGYFANHMFWARIGLLEALAELFKGVSEASDLEVAGAVSLLPLLSGKRVALLHAFDRSTRAHGIEIPQSGDVPYTSSLKNTIIQEMNLGQDYDRLLSSSMVDREFYRTQCDQSQFENYDAVLHYLRFGAHLGLDPCKSFSTRKYLWRYPDVARAGVNPLVHYIKYGANRQASPVLSSSRGDGRYRVFVSCWLKNKESIHDGLLELSERLLADGVRTTFVTNAATLLSEPGVEALSTDFLISNLYPKLSSCNVSFPDWLTEIVEMTRCWEEVMMTSEGARADVGIEARVRSAYAFWKVLFEEFKPRMMLIWGSTAPLSKLHYRLCLDLSIPSLIVERGHFPGTISIDLLAQFGRGGINLRPHSALLANVNCSESDIHHYAEWVRKNQESPYSSKNCKENVEELLSTFRAEQRKIVLFIGVNDLGSGTAYAGRAGVEEHSKLFSSSLQAFHAVRDALRAIDPKAVLMLKPHPSDKTNYSALLSDGDVLVDSHNINPLIVAADVCVSLSTTALARCMLEAKATLNIGISDISMKGAAYECSSLTDIPVQLRAALHGEGLEERSRKGFAFIKYIFEEQLVGVDETTPARLGIRDLSEFISGRIASSPVMSKVDGRLQGRHLLRRLFNPANPIFYKEDYSTAGLKPSRGVDVVIPVYGDAAITKACIDSVLLARGQDDYRIVVIFDASPYEDVKALLEDYRSTEGVVVLFNPVNVGYPATANRGMAYSQDRDVILLNSDTLVTPGWVSRLQRHAYSSDEVATVTPFSNNASIFSLADFPRGAELHGGLEEVARVNEALVSAGGDTIEVPVGHGFCMYVKRTAVRELGFFDEILFGRGYSEEVDFCLRARSLGFKNVCATDVYVGHVGGVSFADTANARKVAARKIISDKFPDYFPEIKKFVSADPFASYRKLV
ncbi:glycosyltransferase [Metapseudomonas lalkuanensis]|uniref:Glycosyltransferase n=1 Tax=Metapseudomonas lalkuanensis TaxID=2604832 RepID=A0A5J6QX13_9GAMM|nr:glycosyltransferase [Pseudomonas lalkuanensis]QEY65416.1 glycosyltransferase [Pseudomonas lalkuanensis]